MLTYYFHELADIGVIEVRAVLFVLSVSCTRHGSAASKRQVILLSPLS
jgi:hypothetical protein